MFVYIPFITEDGFAATRIYVCWQSGVVRSDWLESLSLCCTAIGPRSESDNVEMTFRAGARKRAAYFPHRAIDIQLIRTLFEMMQHLADKFKLNTDVCLNICWQIHSICFQTGQFQCVFMLLYINMKYICIYLVVFLLMEFHDSIRSKSEIIINLTWSFIFIGFGIWNFLEYKKMLESAVDVETSGNFDWYGFLCIANR